MASFEELRARDHDSELYEQEEVSSGELDSFIQHNVVHRVHDPIEQVATELYDLHYPSELDNAESRQEYMDDIVARNRKFGRWFFARWSGVLTRYPDEADHYALRTYRNQDLITPDEQHALHNKTIVGGGLSVGSNVLSSLMQTGVGRKYILMDHDTISPTNLNRLPGATLQDVGLAKTVWLGRKMSETDPYVQQVHYDQGYKSKYNRQIASEQPDMFIEEMDDLAAKAGMRHLAQKLGRPLVMVGDVGERSVLDIERYDINEHQKPFNGRIKQEDYGKLLAKLELDSKKDSGAINDTEYEEQVSGLIVNHQLQLIRVTGIQNISPRMMRSAAKIGKEVGGLPQLGRTARAGASLADLAISEILLGRNIRGGRRVHDARKDIRAPRQDSVREDIRAIKHLIADKTSKSD